MTQPRLMSGADAAAYMGLTPGTFCQWIKDGRAPPALPGTRRWDRKAIDLALDKLSGIVAPSIVPDDECPLEKWKREDAAKQGASGAGGRK